MQNHFPLLLSGQSLVLFMSDQYALNADTRCAAVAQSQLQDLHLCSQDPAAFCQSSCSSSLPLPGGTSGLCRIRAAAGLKKSCFPAGAEGGGSLYLSLVSGFSCVVLTLLCCKALIFICAAFSCSPTLLSL